ncbi:hypothetical protein F5B22DRAFT_645665 [Xylaria bambusicola]|uniref:uncharacterized protein n=1 Tax=Xylaria bambusicola TaxID=326684 RepID=UPI0020080BC9|nr:uncharacterized protein F5B22DRAFT_645665 [Xylaria bambusicola]KAI0517484.1 hypothetical protein F5B22DRAFT_645665 [Xylaria bambusicola]
MARLGGNLTVWADTYVEKILFDRDSSRATLWPSACGFDVVVDNAHVGENLQNHVYVILTARSYHGTDSKLSMCCSQAMPAFIDAHEALVRSVLASSTEASAFYSTFPGYMAFDIKDNALLRPGDSLYVSFAGLDAHHHYNIINHPRVAGEDDGPAGQPARSGRKDVVTFTRGSFSMALRDSSPRHADGVMDDKGRIYNLRVCDPSIVPILPRYNTQAIAYGLAEHVARMITSDLDAE